MGPHMVIAHCSAATRAGAEVGAAASGTRSYQSLGAFSFARQVVWAALTASCSSMATNHDGWSIKAI